MGENTAIEWTQATWNPWMGCHKVSAGCKNCYMFREQKQYGHDPNVVRRSKTTFDAPLKWKEPKLIFVCSWSDFFISEADPWREEAWDIMRGSKHIFQVLTKRIENVRDRLPSDWGEGWPNVWLGVSVEDQARADNRIHLLLEIPAVIRFISAEPLLGELEIGPYLDGAWSNEDAYPVGPTLDWVIVGGESGPNCRPMDPSWARSIKRQCRMTETALFVKQMGGWPNKKGEIPENLRVFEFPEGR